MLDNYRYCIVVIIIIIIIIVIIIIIFLICTKNVEFFTRCGFSKHLFLIQAGITMFVCLTSAAVIQNAD
jgi:hypothetical protein